MHKYNSIIQSEINGLTTKYDYTIHIIIHSIYVCTYYSIQYRDRYVKSQTPDWPTLKKWI